MSESLVPHADEESLVRWFVITFAAGKAPGEVIGEPATKCALGPNHLKECQNQRVMMDDSRGCINLS